MTAPKLGLDETMDLLSQVLGASNEGDEDPNLSAPSAALKANLGLGHLKSPPLPCPLV